MSLEMRVGHIDSKLVMNVFTDSVPSSEPSLPKVLVLSVSFGHAGWVVMQLIIAHEAHELLQMTANLPQGISMKS